MPRITPQALNEYKDIIAAFELGEAPIRQNGMPWTADGIQVLRSAVPTIVNALILDQMAQIVARLEAQEIDSTKADELVTELRATWSADYWERLTRLSRKEELRAMQPPSHRRLLAEEQRIKSLELAALQFPELRATMEAAAVDERREDELLIQEIEAEERRK